MTEIYKYQIFCETDNQWEEAWGFGPISTCPVNSGHTVNTSSVVDIGKKIFTTSADTLTIDTFVVRPDVYYCDTTSNDITITLPKAKEYIGIYFLFVKTSSNNTLTISALTGQVIDGNPTKSITSINDIAIVSTIDGLIWTCNPPSVIDEPVRNVPPKSNVIFGSSYAVSNNVYRLVVTHGYAGKIKEGNIEKISFITWCDNPATGYWFRIYDETNNNIIVEYNGTNTQEQFIVLDTLQNIPTHESILAFQIKPINGGKVHIEDITIITT